MGWGRKKYMRTKTSPSKPTPLPKLFDERLRTKWVYKPGYDTTCFRCGTVEEMPKSTVKVWRVFEDRTEYCGTLCYPCANRYGLVKAVQPKPLDLFGQDE